MENAKKHIKPGVYDVELRRVLCTLETFGGPQAGLGEIPVPPLLVLGRRLCGILPKGSFTVVLERVAMATRKACWELPVSFRRTTPFTIECSSGSGD